MSNTVKYIPEGYHTATPYLTINDAASAIEFYKQAFGATEISRMSDASGRVGHAEIKIGNSLIMLADECPQMKTHSASALGASPVSFVLYVEDVDAFADQALAVGAKVVGPIENKFYGDRMGSFEDPFGYQWHIATHIEDVTPEEMQKRAADYLAVAAG